MNKKFKFLAITGIFLAGFLIMTSSAIAQTREDPASGTLSINKTTVSTGETISLTVTGQDDQGIIYIWAHYRNAWHRYVCPHAIGAPATSCTHVFTFSEPSAGIYTYHGYVSGRDTTDHSDAGYTTPSYVKATVTQTITNCQYRYWFDNDHATACGYKQFCGSYVYYGLRTFNTKQECENALPSTTKEDPVSGTLSVDKTTVSVGGNITVTITAQDDQGVSKVMLWGHHSEGAGSGWDSQYCNGATSCTKTWTLSESTAGNKYYYGYIYGYKTNQTIESAKTVPCYVKATVVATVQNKPDLIISSIITQPASPTTNDKISFRTTIKNNGSQKMPYVSGGIITKISSESLPNPGWRICDAITTRLDSGQTTTIDCPIFQTLPVGSHKFTLSTDDGNRLSESNESNNTKSTYLRVENAVQEDPVSGTLSVDKTTVEVGEEIKLTVTGQDDNGLTKLWAHYQGRWHSDHADGTSFNETWTFSESKPGTYVYRGYVNGKKANGTGESTYTKPSSVTVTVTEKETVVNCKEKYGEHFWCSSYNTWETECRGKGKIQYLPTEEVCQSENNTYRYCATCYEETYPDITITKAEFSDNNQKLYYTVANRGETTAGASQSFFTVDGERGGIDNITSISQGASLISHFDDLACDPGRSYRIGICADWNHKISESNEDNNCYNVTLDCPGVVEKEDPVFGTLSVDKTTVNVGEKINLKVTGQDDNGLTKLWAYYQGAWHSDSADGTSFDKTWTFSESTAGTHVYQGYVYGTQINGNTEYAWTNPQSITVTVTDTQEQTCSDSDKGDIYTKGYCQDSRHVNDGWDMCSDGVYQGGVLEYTCSDSYLGKVCGTKHYSCPNGCENGECIEKTIVTTTCTDSDGGKNYYVKGSANPVSSSIDGRVDCCKLSYSTYMGDSVNHIGPGGGACVTSGSYLYEAICGSDGNPTSFVYQCPNGCQNGVCISATSKADKKEELSSMLASIQEAIQNLMNQLQELKK